jgi:hypothetical protein
MCCIIYCIVVFSTILLDVYAIRVTNVNTVVFMHSCYIDVFISIHIFPSQMQLLYWPTSQSLYVSAIYKSNSSVLTLK